MTMLAQETAHVDYYFEATKDYQNLIDHLKEETMQQLQLSEVEMEVEKSLRELGRKLLESHIENRGSGDLGPSLVDSQGNVLMHRRNRTKSLNTVFGKVSVNRTGYSKPGFNSFFPKDKALNLPKRVYSHNLQKRVARQVANSSYNEVSEEVFRQIGVKIPKRQLEQIAIESAVDFTDFYKNRNSKAVLAEGKKKPIQVLTTDGKGIVMKKEDLREATKKRAQKASHKLDKRLSKGEKRNQKRMSQVAAVYAIDRFLREPEDVISDIRRLRIVKNRPKPHAKRLWASLEKDSKTVISDMFDESQRRDPGQQQDLVVLADGCPTQLSYLEKEIRERNLKATVIVDIVHVIEYLWRASRVFYPESSKESEIWVTDNLRKILNGKANQVASDIDSIVAKEEFNEIMLSSVSDCSRYLRNKAPYLKYDEYLSQGFPIGTGVIEGACRYLIKDRMDITGARWTLKGAESVLKLRSIVKSGDFEDYWKFHEQQEFERNYKERPNIKHQETTKSKEAEGIPDESLMEKIKRKFLKLVSS